MIHVRAATINHFDNIFYLKNLEDDQDSHDLGQVGSIYYSTVCC